jgi:large subunit ribosomal protein L20
MRATNGPATRRRRNRILKRAKGYWGGRSRLWRTAKESVLRADAFAFFGRKQKKRQFRRLWITRLTAAVAPHGLNYSRLIEGLKKANIELNRKELSELAIHDPRLFEQICSKVKAALAS